MWRWNSGMLQDRKVVLKSLSDQSQPVYSNRYKYWQINCMTNAYSFIYFIRNWYWRSTSLVSVKGIEKAIWYLHWRANRKFWICILPHDEGQHGISNVMKCASFRCTASKINGKEAITSENSELVRKIHGLKDGKYHSSGSGWANKCHHAWTSKQAVNHLFQTIRIKYSSSYPALSIEAWWVTSSSKSSRWNEDMTDMVIPRKGYTRLDAVEYDNGTNQNMMINAYKQKDKGI